MKEKSEYSRVKNSCYLELIIPLLKFLRVPKETFIFILHYPNMNNEIYKAVRTAKEKRIYQLAGTTNVKCII